MRKQKVGYNMWTVTYMGKVRFFTTETDANDFMEHMEKKIMGLE